MIDNYESNTRNSKKKLAVFVVALIALMIGVLVTASAQTPVDESIRLRTQIGTYVFPNQGSGRLYAVPAGSVPFLNITESPVATGNYNMNSNNTTRSIVGSYYLYSSITSNVAIGTSIGLDIEIFKISYNPIVPCCFIDYGVIDVEIVNGDLGFRTTTLWPADACEGTNVSIALTSVVGYDDFSNVTITGPGVSGGNFSSGGLSPGNYSYSFSESFDNGNYTDTRTFRVKDLLPVPNTSNQTFCGATGTQVINIGNADQITWPAGAPVSFSSGSYRVNTATSGSWTLSAINNVSNASTECPSSKTFALTVNAPVSVNAGANLTRCINAGNLSLSGASPSGGSWSGSGVSGSTFNPVTAGTGTHTITYTVTSSGCSYSDTRTVTVYAAPTANAGANIEVCVDDASVVLGGSPSGGSWSGPGVSGSRFYPATAGSGNHTLTYNYTNANGCSDTDTRTATVRALPSVNAGSDQTVCITDANFALSGSPSGGSWTGPGVSGNRFYPSSAGAGTHNLTYSATNANGCTNTDVRRIIVNPVTSVDAGTNATFCTNSSTYNLNNDLDPDILGGTWSGSGVNGINFVPGSVPVGSYTIRYTFTNASGCTSSDTKVFTVVEGPVVDAGGVIEACQSEGVIDLLGQSPLGGTWSGLGVVGGTSTVDVASLSPGNYVLTYSYDNGQCITTDSRQLVVNSSSVVDAGNNLQVCSNDADFLLTGASRSGGIWSGNGVSGGYFSPAAVGNGTYTITYSYSNNDGCESSDTRLITVNEVPVVDAGSDLVLCTNDGVYSLINDVNITGGTFSGTGVVALNYRPDLAGEGVHAVTYRYTDPGNGCDNTDVRFITVIKPQTVTVGSNIITCIDSPPFDISGAESISGGIWSGSGLSGTMFNPASAGIGLHVMTYTVPDANGCNSIATKSITVKRLPVTEAGQDIFVCSGAPLVSLSGTGTPIGGTWSGDFVTGSNFDVASSGAGTFTVTYNYIDVDGCANTDDKQIIVDAGTSVTAGVDFSVCETDALVDLASRVSPGGGSFTGPGVVGNNFNPSIGPGSYTVTYSLSNSFGCAGTDNVVITVNAEPAVNAGTDGVLCLNEPPVDLMLTALPVGGVFTGPGVAGNNFDPIKAGIGEHQITYTYTNASGCEAVDFRFMEVTALPTVNAGKNLFLCVDNGLVDLGSEASPVNGTWSGPGINSELFDPAVAGIGTHVIRYTIVQGNGCTNYDEKVITVFEELTIDAGSDITVCSNEGILNLNETVSLVGGTWSGTGVSGTNFNPSIGQGSYQVQYTYTNQFGCTDSDTKIITVIKPQSVSVGSAINVCVTAPELNLSVAVNPTGGTWSGSGVIGEYFYPALAGVGTHDLEYFVVDNQGCDVTKVRKITVNNPDAIDAGANKVICVGSNLIDLDIGVSETGGTWTGNGVNGSFFDPEIAGIGSHIVTYTYNWGSNCISTDSKTITVRDNITVNAGVDFEVCKNAAAVDLTNHPNKIGGIWTGNGISGSSFNPANVSQGLHVLTYAFTDNFGCSATDNISVTVLPSTAVDAGPPLEMCVTANSINLMLSAFPQGGIFSGAGLNGNFFNPQLVGIGQYTISYDYSDANGCNYTDTRTIRVVQPDPVNAGANLSVCLNSGLVNLDTDVSEIGGIWTGPQV